jgi:hypothetical protein
MRSLDLDALLGGRFPEATFHDAELLGFDLDFEKAVVRLRFEIVVDCEVPESQRRTGVLELREVHSFSMETPRESGEPLRRRSLWITADGALPDPQIPTALDIPKGLPDEAFCHYLYASNTNSFLVFAANVAVFTWTEL